MLFRKEYSKRTHCPKCNEPRYGADGNPVRVFPYIQLVPRIRAMFASKNWSLMFENQFRRAAQDGIISDVADGEVYKDVMRQVGHSKYHVPFLLGVDGITMDEDQNLSVEPLALVNLFIPPELRTKSAFTTLCGITPTNAKNTRIFMEPMLEEFASHFEVFDALTGQWHASKLVLVCGSFDLKAIPKFTCGKDTGAYYCCHVDAFRGSVNPANNKRCYMGHYIYSAADCKDRDRCYSCLTPDAKQHLTPTDGPPAKRSRKTAIAAARLAAASKEKVGSQKHPSFKNYYKELPLIRSRAHSCIMGTIVVYTKNTSCI